MHILALEESNTTQYNDQNEKLRMCREHASTMKFLNRGGEGRGGGGGGGGDWGKRVLKRMDDAA